jgi:hypothetical protein
VVVETLASIRLPTPDLSDKETESNERSPRPTVAVEKFPVARRLESVGTIQRIKSHSCSEQKGHRRANQVSGA